MTEQRRPFAQAVADQDWLGAHVLMIEALLEQLDGIEPTRERVDTIREIRLWVASAQKAAEGSPVEAPGEPTLDERLREMVSGL